MGYESKVVKLRQETFGRSALPLPLVHLQDRSAGLLQALLGEFFDSADDALFAMSDRSGTNKEQTLYFEAMRELRLQRKGMTLSFLQWVARAFNEIGRFDPKGKVSGAFEATDRDSLSLVEDSALEERVALDTMISKVRNHHNEQILLVHVRIEHLLPAVKIGLEQNPLGPEVLCQGLGDTCADVDLDIRAKLIIFKLFEKLLVGRLDAIYQEANSQLVQDGVLPHLRRAPRPDGNRKDKPYGAQAGNSSTSGHAGHRGPGSGGGREFSGDQTSSETFSELAELLHESGRQQGFPIAQSESGSAGSVSTRHLVGLLSGFQGKLQEPGIRMPTGSNLERLVGKLIAHQQSGSGQVEQIDADVINLVSMLFDFILEDRQLPETMKALLARLQIPILKVALLDRSFFNRGGHPARKLLNELAMAAVSWSEKKEGQRDPLREKVQEVVDRFISEFDNDIGLIQTLLDDFSQFMDQDRRRRELVEQRLRDAEEGRARIAQAKEAVADVLTKARDGHRVSAAALPLIEEVWAKVLNWFFLREGEKSENWLQSVATTELLLWTLDPKPINSGTRAAMLKAVPQVADSVRNGLQTIGWDPFAADKLMRDLEMLHVDVLQNVSLLQQPPAESDPTTTPASGPRESTGVREAGLRDNLPPESAVVAEAHNVEPRVSCSYPAEGRESVKGGAGADAPEEAGTRTAISAEWLHHAESLRVGSWLELHEGEDRKLRCKLAAVIRATGKYIFVNRSGTKVAEYRRVDVAQALQEGRLTVLDDGLIFDRALESVIGNLRSNRRD